MCMKQQLNCDPDLCQQEEKKKERTYSPQQPKQYNDIILFSWTHLDLDFFFSHVWHFVKHNGAQDVEHKGRVEDMEELGGRDRKSVV